MSKKRNKLNLRDRGKSQLNQPDPSSGRDFILSSYVTYGNCVISFYYIKTCGQFRLLHHTPRMFPYT